VRQNGYNFDAIGFGMGDLLPRVANGRKDLEAVFSVEENEWTPSAGARQGDPAVQLKLKDIR
jgi:hypothetical protein